MYFVKEKIGPSEVYDTPHSDQQRVNVVCGREKMDTSEKVFGHESNILNIVFIEEYGLGQKTPYYDGSP